ncbi:MAG TPA: PEPxxWA-CTERM sorting domain-containing protein [Caulobacteraceae bacterium]|jgi:hypothetical protein
MKKFVLVASIAGLMAATALGSASAGTTVTTINGTDNIFAAGLNAIPAVPQSTGGEGTLPYDFAVSGNEQLFVTTSGTVTCCDGNQGVPPSTAHGFDTNPFNGFPNYSKINNILGTSVPDYDTSATGGGIFELLYIFTDSNHVPIGTTLNHLSNNGMSGFITAPSNATNLYFGFADGFGFEGRSDAYGDNAAEDGVPGITLSISPTPEPTSWALMLLGVGAVGFALRRRQGASLGASAA